MSSTDKTRQKLMDSMRKTKAGSTSKSGTPKSDTKASSSAAQSKPAAKPAAKPAPAKRKPARQPVKKGGGDPYQVGRRVWPD